MCTAPRRILAVRVGYRFRTAGSLVAAAQPFSSATIADRSGRRRASRGRSVRTAPRSRAGHLGLPGPACWCGSPWFGGEDGAHAVMAVGDRGGLHSAGIGGLAVGDHFVVLAPGTGLVGARGARRSPARREPGRARQADAGAGAVAPVTRTGTGSRRRGQRPARCRPAVRAVLVRRWRSSHPPQWSAAVE
jgi:hypothetical protein